MRPAILAAAALVALPLAAAHAQYTLTRQSHLVQSDSASRAVAARLRADVAALRGAEDAYFAAHRRYTAEVRALPSFRPTSGGAIRVTRADQTGWAAVATHPALPGSAERLTVVRAEPGAASSR